MIGTYDGWLVLLSFIVAINASFVALDSAARVVAARGTQAARYWLAGGSLSMGIGIWSMHFIGMLSLRLPIALSYDLRITLLSLAIAVVVSAFAIYVTSRGTLSLRRLLAGGALLGAGIASMHYSGMAAMKMEPPIQYAPALFGLSLLIAMAASVAALWAAFELRQETILTAFWKKAGSAVLMGGGICGMHYTGMAAAIFSPESVCTVSPQHINNAWLGGALGGVSLLLLVAVLLIAAFDAHLAAVFDARVAERTAALDLASRELRRLSRRLAEAQDEERRRLAAELHDIVGQNLSALNAEIALIRDQLPPGAADGLAQKLANASALTKQSVEAIRSVMAQLRPPGMDELGFVAALRWHAEALEARTGIKVTVVADEALPGPSPAVEDSLLRIYVEALNNAAKHSGARTVRVTYEARTDKIVLSIADDGGGFDIAMPTPRDDKSGWGLMIMKERALQAGGELRIDSARRAGTRIEFVISKETWG